MVGLPPTWLLHEMGYGDDNIKNNREAIVSGLLGQLSMQYVIEKALIHMTNEVPGRPGEMSNISIFHLMFVNDRKKFNWRWYNGFVRTGRALEYWDTETDNMITGDWGKTWKMECHQDSHHQTGKRRNPYKL